MRGEGGRAEGNRALIRWNQEQEQKNARCARSAKLRLWGQKELVASTQSARLLFVGFSANPHSLSSPMCTLEKAQSNFLETLSQLAPEDLPAFAGFVRDALAKLNCKLRFLCIYAMDQSPTRAHAHCSRKAHSIAKKQRELG
jgi:hypothetical protein